LYDASRFSGHGEGCEFKMWRSGASASGNYAIGYASCFLPSVPTLLSPKDGSVDICPLTNTKFDWSDSEGNPPITYRIQLSMSDTFVTTVFDISVTTSEYTYSGTLSPLTQYFWRVNATGIEGTSDWSQVFSFTTGSCISPANPQRYLFYYSLRPLAENNIGEALEISKEVENLLKLAEERGLDATQCKVFYEKGLKYLSLARRFLAGENAVTANTYAIYAQKEFMKARDCLLALMG